MAISCDALQVYEGLGTLTGVATAAERARLEHRLVGFVPGHPALLGRRLHAAGPRARSTRPWRRDGRPIVVGGTGLYLRAALAELSLVKAPPEAEDSELWSPETRHPTTIFGLDMDRAALYERIDARTEAIVAGGALRRRCGAPRRSARRAPPARRSASTSCSAGDLEAMKKRSRNYARRQLTWMRKIPNLQHARPQRPRATPRSPQRSPPPSANRLPPVKFEKWQALGNDYLILEVENLPGS